MKKLNGILRKCKSLSTLGRTSSYSSLRSKSTREEDELWAEASAGEEAVVVLVGSSRRRYTINSKHLHHPLLNALIQRSKHNAADENISVKCEVVLFDHLLWMLENADLDDVIADGSLEELASLYVS